MSDESSDQPTQETPHGQTIPVPKRDDVLRALERLARPNERDGGDAEQT